MVEVLEEKLARIERREQEILKLFQSWIQLGAPIYMSDFLLIGVAKRTLSLSEGFRMLIAGRNFTSAAGLVRMQLDTALRVFAGSLVPDSENYAEAVFMGRPVNKMRDKDGNRLTDSHLAKKLSEIYPWVLPVYKELCDVVHFTSRHIFAGAAKADDDTRTVYFQISAKDPPRPEEDYFEVVEAFYELMRVTATLATSWQIAKQEQRSPDAPTPGPQTAAA